MITVLRVGATKKKSVGLTLASIRYASLFFLFEEKHELKAGEATHALLLGTLLQGGAPSLRTCSASTKYWGRQAPGMPIKGAPSVGGWPRLPLIFFFLSFSITVPFVHELRGLQEVSCA